MIKSDLHNCLTIILNNIRLNVHDYDCNAYQKSEECNCSSYSDDEIASMIALSFGYKIEKIKND